MLLFTKQHTCTWPSLHMQAQYASPHIQSDSKNSENILKILNFILDQGEMSFVFLFNFSGTVANKLLSFYVKAFNAILLFYGRLRVHRRNRMGMKKNWGFSLDKIDDR